MAGAPDPGIEVADHWTETDFATAAAGLIEHNQPFLGRSDYRRLAVTARHDGRLIGAIMGETGRQMAHLDLVWVADHARGRRLGSRLIEAAFEEARRRDCKGVWLDTYDFQARGFYEKHGFEQFAELAGFANGHTRYFMVKRF